MSQPVVVIAGATGTLGKKIVREVVGLNARVRALVRPASSESDVNDLKSLNAQVVEVDPDSVVSISDACKDAACVISSLAGLRRVIVETQKTLLDAAIAAGVPRFIPSDFAVDFYKVPDGENRNLDLRRDFAEYLDSQPIKATSILNGIFSEFMFTPAPFVATSIRRSIYFGSKQEIDTTSMDDAAAYTARAALDAETPRYLRIAGNVLTPDGLAAEATAAFGKRFSTLYAGPLWSLKLYIKVAKALDNGQDLYPAFQGMQYAHNMMSGKAKLNPLDNDRYPDMRWTPLRETLAAGKPDFID